MHITMYMVSSLFTSFLAYPSLPSFPHPSHLFLPSLPRSSLRTHSPFFSLPFFKLSSILHFPAAMATIARHVIANEYSLADESVKTVSDSHSQESTPHPPEDLAHTPHPPEDLARTRLEESSREESPSSTSSSQEPCDSTVVSLDCIHCIPYIHT